MVGWPCWHPPPLFSGLGAASTAAGWCISAGAPPRPLTRFRFRVQLLVFHVYHAFGLHPRFSRQGQKSVRFFRFCFPRLEGPLCTTKRENDYQYQGNKYYRLALM